MALLQKQQGARVIAATGVASPCTGVCQMASTGHCLGCGRLLAEIAEWGQADTARRQHILGLARRRLGGDATSLLVRHE